MSHGKRENIQLTSHSSKFDIHGLYVIALTMRHGGMVDLGEIWPS